jgi:hypothetical protein
MLEWAGPDYSIDKIRTKFNATSPGVEFEGNSSEPVTVFGGEIDQMTENLIQEFKKYFDILKG